MADSQQLALLLQGADQWNAWRAANATTAIDLSNANLAGANLSSVLQSHFSM